MAFHGPAGTAGGQAHPPDRASGAGTGQPRSSRRGRRHLERRGPALPAKLWCCCSSSSLLVATLQIRFQRGLLLESLNRLPVPSSIADVQAALRRELLDDDLLVLTTDAGTGAWFDAAGNRARLPTQHDRHAKAVTALSSEPEARTAIVFDARLDRYRALVEDAVTMSRFALENARLESGLRNQLDSLQQARARLLATGLDQRRQLERDLHDGAQQRLLALGLRLSALETSAPDKTTAEAVSAIRKELRLALEELRDLAHGIYPAVLSQAGLGAAVESLTERLPVPVTIDLDRGRWHPDVESAAYLVISEALSNTVKHAGKCRIVVEVRDLGSVLAITVRDDGLGSDELRGSDLKTLNDRVAAIGGELKVQSSRSAGTTVRATIPCV